MDYRMVRQCATVSTYRTMIQDKRQSLRLIASTTVLTAVLVVTCMLCRIHLTGCYSGPQELTVNYPIKCSGSVLSDLNRTRLNYHISRGMVTNLNKGIFAGVNRGQWLSMCRRDKRKLAYICKKYRAQLNK